jgi:hypothetical protein
MARVVLATVALALAVATPAAAADETAFTPQQGFASPEVRLGSRTATELCALGVAETRFVPPPPGAVVAVQMPPPPPPCSRQPGVRPLEVGRARTARITLQAPANQVLAAWYRRGALQPLAAVRTGSHAWNVTLPPTSGRLILSLVFDLRDGLPVCCARRMRLDWKLSVRRTLAGPPSPPPAPSPRRRPSAPTITFNDSDRG